MEGDPKPEEEYGDDDRDFEDDPPYDEDEQFEDEFEEAISNCGEVPGGGCMQAGTEYCDFECPFRDAMIREMNRCRDSKGRFCKPDN